MGGGLINSSTEGIVKVTGQMGLGEVIKPLSREIHLFDTYIAGTTHLKDASVFDDIKPGDPLFLRREDNKFDGNAILVLNDKKQKLGYVPEKDNVVFARLMDAGKCLSGKIKRIDPKGESFKIIMIEIYLIDF